MCYKWCLICQCLRICEEPIIVLKTISLKKIVDKQFGCEKLQIQFILIFVFFSSRYKISDCAAAALANGLMKGLGVISEGHNVEFLDP